MKQILEYKLNKVIGNLKNEEIETLFDHIHSSHDAVQKKIIHNRSTIMLLTFAFWTLFLDFFVIEKIPGFEFEGGISSGILKDLELISLNHLVLWGIVIFFFWNYFRLIIHLIYRSQFRLLYNKLYKKYSPLLFSENLFAYAMPYQSLGYILKVRSKLFGSQGIEEGSGVIRFFRYLFKNLERLFHWAFMVYAPCILLSHYVNTYGTWGFSLKIVVIIICVILVLYGFFISLEYNNYWGLFNKKFNRFIEHTKE